MILENTENTSEDLLKRYLASSSRAPFQIHERYQNRLIKLANKRLMGVLKSKVDPADVAQETFQAFFDLANAGEIRWQKNGDLWRLLAGIAINKVKRNFEQYAAAKRDVKSETSQPSDTLQVLGGDDASAIELTELVEHVLGTEKPLVRSVLEMRLGGFSNEDIARKIGRSARTVRRVLESLQAKLIADNELEFGVMLDGYRKGGTKGGTGGGDRREKFTSANEQLTNIDYHDFQLLQMIGQGGFAKVYLAKQISTGELFAIKAIRKKWLTDLATRTAFLNEAKLLETFDDPHIVKTFGIGKLPNGGCFLLLEFIDGKPILQAAKERSPAEAKTWLRILDSTIQKIHAAGIVHGDIRPSNVLVDSSGRVRLVDFGLGHRIKKESLSSTNEDIQAIGFIKSQILSCIAGT